MKLKPKRILSLLVVGGAVLATLPMFAAFEAHVVNVTASIENALSVPVEISGLTFGTVFPEEVLHKNLDIQLSGSFMTEGRVDDVEYMIRQKPKCGLPVASSSPTAYSAFGQVSEDAEGNFECPEGYVELPLLCPYLSKHELTTDGSEQENDSAGIDAFHGPLTGWTMSSTLATQVTGRLVKGAQDIADQWDIDLHAPCFGGQCAQDNVIPLAYQADARNEHQMFGCDLWVEVTGISLSSSSATLTVIKHVVNNDNGTSTASAFTMLVNGVNVSSSSFPGAENPGVGVVLDPGAYSVAETGPEGYAQNLSADCSGTIAVGEHKTCTITNDDVPPVPPATLTVNKVVVGSDANPNSFVLFVDGDVVTNGVPSAQVLGAHVVSEGSAPDYHTVISGDCDIDGNVTVTAEGETCTITNTHATGTITVHKTVDDPGALGTQNAAQFQMTIDGQNVDQDTPIIVATGAHTVSEVDNLGDTVTYSLDCPAGLATVSEGNNTDCTVTNTVPFGTVTVTKVVNNLFGGTAIVSSFNLSVGAIGVTSGVSKNVAPGIYLVSESGVSGYEGVLTGDCDSDSQLVTVGAGDNKNCTITNTDIKPNVTLIKNVVNDSGGSATSTSFVMHIDTSTVFTGGSKSVFSNTNHTITEDAKAGYHFVSITGAGCPAGLGVNFQLLPGQAITCTITNSDDGGGQ